ncbi:PH domain-containing protein [Halosolutus amylolyticus]|uniref:PH domain-containing protein n=1 Tax=Halosolutus amylolyticus TaxID=2932267 RepID=A0ABD5PV93_9EURY|nr:PH domain-containing protein [Halosolutus amylolyticus]
MTTPDRRSGAEDVAWLTVGADEEVRWQGGPRIQTVYPWVALAVVGALVIAAAVVLEVLSPLGLLWLPVLAAPGCWQYARVSRTTFLITNRRVAVRSGVLGVTVRVVGLERVQNTRVTQNPIGRLIGYGRVTIETAGGSDLVFWNVETPSDVRARLEAQRTGPESRRLPGSREQWASVLAEVRAWRRALDRSR